MFLTLTSVLICVIILWYFHRYLTFLRYIEKVPGPPTIPILGNAHQVGSNPQEHLSILLKWWKQYGYDKFRVWIGNVVFIVITDPKDIEAVLSSSTLIEKGLLYKLLRPWLGDGLLTSTGKKWHKHRKMITPSFHFKILIDFLDVMNKNGNKFVENLEEKAKSGKIFDIQEMIHYCTLDIICETAMGTNLNSMDNPKSDVVTAIQDMCYTIQNAAFSPFKKNPYAFKLTSDYYTQRKALNVLKEFTLKVIEERRKTLEKLIEIENDGEKPLDNGGVKQRKAFLDNLLTSTIDGRPLTLQEIFEEVSTFMFEGHDTTTSGIAFSIYLLSRHQDIQKNVYEEQKQIFGSNNDIMERNPTYQEIQNMKYLDLVIKEAQRLYPSVPFIARFCNEEFNLNGLKIPKNSTITLFIMAMGLNEKYFKDPYKVDVNRFDPTKREKSNPYEYVPFSAGPRNCIGQKFAMLEMKSIVSNIVRKFEILPPEDDNNCDCGSGSGSRSNSSSGTNAGTSNKNENLQENKNTKYDPQLAAVLTLKSENGVQIRLRKREKL